ncbi:zinc-dependent alcohol dehydrogenase [Novosphingobium taihuense]|uniref:(R,R)-butanediol dehydrogenase/meso-butanediol dehydrogenase/diacetyl reductase n=1 Tax=Novosphingobium taihuense TaxID=260085 RepID=A0A7W7ADI5_9SPHN|nr:alcohol dehydrogenase catalytic domain-containing protein [Novosphingobium taihuense]MBB4614309.1 (R,R)-butanediol dehydrogenase/meso-butanediol dehydrogenase/diacetyl reductase [Novosphingobium taihuense]TWH87155.1 threonine dehydrogenase-like Zn-dependent dehydrogenase [Novosphingobium taihuense]
MRALLYKGPGEPLALENIADPEPGEGEVVIRVARCGVCGTDVHATSGHSFPMAPDSQLGHEYGGEIVALGKGVDHLKIGDRIAAMTVIGCGHCEGCKSGIDLLCTNQFQGYAHGLAEYARVHARGATILPATMSIEDSSLVEPLSVGGRAVRLANPDKTSKILIIGPGPIGLSVLFWLRQRGIENVVMLASSNRRKPLSEKMGGDKFIVESDEAKDEIYSILGGAPDIVFEAAGMPGVINRSIDLVKGGGLVVGLGFCLQPDTIVPGMAMIKDVTVRWSTIFTREDFAASATAIDRDTDLARAMVTDIVGMDGASAAFEEFRKGTSGSGKLQIDPWG